MDFEQSEEQKLLRDTLRRFVSERCAFIPFIALHETRDTRLRLWRECAELGLPGLPFDERDGGLGGGATDIMIVQEELGRGLALDQFLPTVVLSGGLIRRAANSSQRTALIQAIAGGNVQLAFAHAERTAGQNAFQIATSAESRTDGSWVLNGEKIVVLNGADADTILVSARIHGNPADRKGIGIFLVRPDADGVSIRRYVMQDGRPAANVTLSGVRVSKGDVLGDPGSSAAAIEGAMEDSNAALCAEALGAMAALFELTIEFLKTRRQFGVPIGTFQALQHRAVDMLIALEEARSMTFFAAMMLSESDDRTRAKAIAAAKVQIGRSARFIGEQAIQLHGGLGMTMEYKAGHYFKRLIVLDLLGGDADHHLSALAKFDELMEVGQS